MMRWLTALALMALLALPAFGWLRECGDFELLSPRGGILPAGIGPEEEPTWTTRACMPRFWA